jgi:phosphoribosylamine-glycine ligase
VLTVSALGEDLHAARTRAYDAVHALADRIGTRDLSYRTDIAKLE